MSEFHKKGIGSNHPKVNYTNIDPKFNITNKRRFIDEETIQLEASCNAIIQKFLSLNSNDPDSFTIIYR